MDDAQNGGMPGNKVFHCASQSTIAAFHAADPLSPRCARVWKFINTRVSGAAKRPKSLAWTAGSVTLTSQTSGGGGWSMTRNRPRRWSP